MKVFKVEITRRFYVTDEVFVQAESETEANELAWANYDSLKSELPEMVYAWLEFEDSDIHVEDEATEEEYQEYLESKNA